MKRWLLKWLSLPFYVLLGMAEGIFTGIDNWAYDEMELDKCEKEKAKP